MIVKEWINCAPGGAAMPRAFIKKKADVRAEAEPLAANLVRFCTVHTENWSEQW